ncbi:MAG: hypothetical protein NTZ44_00615 [Candidatus Nomurabacteria bacterium]|nr:hypothetical protein [Candidatus Nomurabacteria bacterium]
MKKFKLVLVIVAIVASIIANVVYVPEVRILCFIFEYFALGFLLLQIIAEESGIEVMKLPDSETGETISKDFLNSGYYYEGIDGFWKSLAKLLPIFPKEILLQQINEGVKTEEQMMDGRNWLSRKEAMSFGAQNVKSGEYKDGKVRIYFFKDEENKGQRSELCVCLDGDSPDVDVGKFNPENRWRNGRISYSRK